MSLDISIPSDIRIAQEFYDKKILPDNNPEFVKRVLRVVSIYSCYNLFEYSITYLNEKTRKSSVDFVEKHLLSTLNELNRFSTMINNYGKIVRLVFQSSQTADIIKELKKNLELLEVDINKKGNSIEAFMGDVKDLPELHSKLFIDKIKMAEITWDLRKVIKDEIKLRREQGKKLSPPKREREVKYPTYRKEWELTAKILNYFFKRNSIPTNDIFPRFPISEDAIRQFANRYKKHKFPDIP